jgi:hypothetical protein
MASLVVEMVMAEWSRHKLLLITLKDVPDIDYVIFKRRIEEGKIAREIDDDWAGLGIH